MAFPCPGCGSAQTKVSNTEKRGYRVKRYQRCNSCGLRFRTLELPEQKPRRGVPKRGKPKATRGEANGRAVMSESDVLAIRLLLEAGYRQSQIARHYGLAASQISRIANRKSWRHLRSPCHELPPLPAP